MSNFGVGIPHCHHNIPAELKTSDNIKNPGRRYYCCRYRFKPNDCGLWGWYDEGLSSHYKQYFLRMKAERDNALRNEGANVYRPDFDVAEDNALANNGEDGSAKIEEFLAIAKAMSSTQKTMEYQIKMIYVAFALLVFLFVVYKG